MSAWAYRVPVKEIGPNGWPSIWATWPSPSRTPKDMPWGEAKRTMRTASRLVGAIDGPLPTSAAPCRVPPRACERWGAGVLSVASAHVDRPDGSLQRRGHRDPDHGHGARAADPPRDHVVG